MLSRNLTVAAFPIVLAALATLDCGGKLDTSLLPACPYDGTCSSDCKQTFTDCSGTHELACTCDATGHAQCPELGAPNCQSDCDALMHGSTTCNIEGEKCPSPEQVACLDAPTLYCTCESGQFVCDVPSPNCPTPACPPPDQVKPGAACAMSYGMCQSNIAVTDCNGNLVGYEECSCGSNGVYECSSPPMPPCAVDAGSADALLTSD
ncbi:MAG TPA: hypothetical protein VLM85_26750 [Polyangiaceae bacterium]|nr:hypothetical protein [Polyangiaceae bacterium]